MADIRGIDGTVKGQIELPEKVFGRTEDPGLIWEAVQAYLANQRQGNASTKTRSEVSGTGKKPYRQKHAGRARHGSRRSPIFTGGGIAWGPKPRDYSKTVPKKKRRAALLLALAAGNAEGGMSIVEDFEPASSKTKELVQMLAQLGFGKDGKRVLILVAAASEKLTRASRNVPWLTVMPASLAHTYAMLANERVVFTKTGLERFIAVFGCGTEEKHG